MLGSRTAAERATTRYDEIPPVELGADGSWRYSGTDVLAVGAVAQTLADVVNVREVGVPGETPDAVLLSLSEIVADSRLNWALQKGKRLSGDDDEMFLVPWPVWQEHAAEPVSVWLPERDAEGVHRRLAATERSLRLLREASERAADARTHLVLIASDLGVTRRHLGETLGLSAGRIQQLHDDATPAQIGAVRALLEEATLLLAQAGDRFRRDELERPPGWSVDKLEETIAEMVDTGLLDEADGVLHVTETGERLGDAKRKGSRRARA